MRTQPWASAATCTPAEPTALIGRYAPPDVHRGDRVYCRYRKAWCRVTGWGDGPIRWPRVQQVGVGGQPGLLVNATLERAIRTESAAALMHWFGVSAKPVIWWRRAFGVGGHVATRGSRRLHKERARRAAAARHGQPVLARHPFQPGELT